MKTLTAWQLIAELRKLPPDTLVYRGDSEWGVFEIREVREQAAWQDWFDPEDKHPAGVVLK